MKRIIPTFKNFKTSMEINEGMTVNRAFPIIHKDASKLLDKTMLKLKISQKEAMNLLSKYFLEVFDPDFKF